MLILKIDPERPDRAALDRAVAALKSGGTVVYPTETAYALGCDPFDAKAVRRLFSIKRRDASKALPFIAASTALAFKSVDAEPYERKLAKRFWPGPLTLVVRLKKDDDAFSSGGKNPSGQEIAIRVSPHPVAAALSRGIGGPVVSTSANRSGGATNYDIPSVLRDLGAQPDVILDAGPLARTAPSTIVRVTGGTLAILREGPITEAEIRAQMTDIGYTES